MKSRIVQSMLIGAVAVSIGSVLAQNTKPHMMPYTAVDHPEFVTASKADFLSDGDVVVGVARGKIARAYPAADLNQHGVVLDQMPDGPIAVTW